MSVINYKPNNNSGNINLPKALAALNSLQKAQGTGDMEGMRLAFRELKLQADEHKISQNRKHDKEIKSLQDKLFDAKNKLQMKMSENTLKKKIQDALDAGDMPLFNRLMNLYTQSATPSNIQAADHFRSQEYESTEDRADTRDLLGGSGQTALEKLKIAREKGHLSEGQFGKGVEQEFITEPEATDLDKNIALIRKLHEDGILTDSQYQRALEEMTQKPTGNQKDIEFIKKMVSDGVLTEEEGKELIQDIYDDNGADAGTGVNPSAVIQGFAVNDPIRRSENNLSVDMTKDQRENLSRRVYNIIGNTGWEDLEDTQKSAVADIYANAVETSKQAGGEIAGREAVAMQTMRRELPSVKNHLDILHNAGIQIGKELQIRQGILSITGEVTDPKVGAAITQINNLTNAFIALRSGAAVTENEFQRYQSMLSNIGKSNEFNQSIVNEMINISDRAVRFYYDKKLDGKIVDQIMEDTRTIVPLEQMPEDIQALDDTERENLNAWIDQLSGQDKDWYDLMKESGYTDIETYRKYLEIQERQNPHRSR